jgi:hypothetical protein
VVYPRYTVSGCWELCSYKGAEGRDSSIVWWLDLSASYAARRLDLGVEEGALYSTPIGVGGACILLL